MTKKDNELLIVIVVKQTKRRKSHFKMYCLISAYILFSTS